MTRQTYLVKETNRGVYLWKVPGKGFVSDGEGHFLMIEAVEGDKFKIGQLRSMVNKDFGIYDGNPQFFRGNRIVDDETYDEQLDRYKRGLTPDVRDVLVTK